MTLALNGQQGSETQKTQSQQCGSAAAVFPIVAPKNGAAESAVEVHGTPVCFEFLQQFFHVKPLLSLPFSSVPRENVGILMSDGVCGNTKSPVGSGQGKCMAIAAKLSHKPCPIRLENFDDSPWDKMEEASSCGSWQQQHCVAKRWRNETCE